MNNQSSDIERAWEELSFWRDFAVWWKARHQGTDEHRILEALENAEAQFKDATRNNANSKTDLNRS